MDDEIRRYFEDLRGELVAFRDETRQQFARVDQRLARLEQGSEQVDQRFEQVDRRFDQLDRRFEQIDQRFEQVDQRFEQVNQRFEQVDQRFEQVDQRFVQIDQRSEQVDHRLAQIDHRFAQTDERITREAVETRRHFGVFAEALQHRIEIVAEMTAANTEAIGRNSAAIEQLREQMGLQFAGVRVDLGDLRRDVDALRAGR